MAPLLKVSSLVKRFGGIVAVNDVSFEIHKGETLGFIGPNGAGKSTVVNCLTGYLPATSGKIEMNGVDITRMKPHERAYMGLARTYQIPRPFPELTALTSVLASSVSGKKRINQSFQDAMYDATHYLEFVGLFSKRNILARDLTFYELGKGSGDHTPIAVY
jgi:branched-chain amino acid transport system ATP-binding protein